MCIYPPPPPPCLTTTSVALVLVIHLTFWGEGRGDKPVYLSSTVLLRVSVEYKNLPSHQMLVRAVQDMLFGFPGSYSDKDNKE